MSQALCLVGPGPGGALCERGRRVRTRAHCAARTALGAKCPGSSVFRAGAAMVPCTRQALGVGRGNQQGPLWTRAGSAGPAHVGVKPQARPAVPERPASWDPSLRGACGACVGQMAGAGRGAPDWRGGRRGWASGLGRPGDTCGAERAVIGVAGGVEGIGPGPARWQVRAGCAVIGGPGGGAGRAQRPEEPRRRLRRVADRRERTGRSHGARPGWTS